MRPFNLVSLGWGCAIRTELIRRYFPEQPTLFFDYLGNFDGLDTCASILLNEFQDFQTVEDFCFFPHPRWNTDKELLPIPICFNPVGAAKKEILVSCRYPNLIFYHYDQTASTVQSFTRKSKRLTTLLQDTPTPLVFLYYRQYDEPLNDNYAEQHDYSITAKLAMLEAESLRFRDAMERKYPRLTFTLIALIAEPLSFHAQVTPAIDDFLQRTTDSPTRKIIFDRVLAASPEDTRKLSAQSWGRIYRRHLIPNPMDRLRKAAQNLPAKIKKLRASITRKPDPKAPPRP